MSAETSRGERALRALRPVRVYHPMLLALIPLCGLYVQNAGRAMLTLGAMARPALVLIGTALVLWLAFAVLRRNRYHGGLLASAVILPLFVLWGALEDAIRIAIPMLGTMPRTVFYLAILAGAAVFVVHVMRQASGAAAKRRALIVAGSCLLVAFVFATFVLAPMFGRRAAWLITGYLAAAAYGVVYVWRYKGDCLTATRSMNWFAVILLALYGAVLLVNSSPQPDIKPPQLAVTLPASPMPTTQAPDIYVFALDGYARGDVLRTAYAYNNLYFEQEMRTLGFQIVEGSRANYPQAVLSLTALLNMGYVQDLVAESERATAGIGHVFALYHNNRLFDLLRQQGYEILSFSPGSEPLEPREENGVVRLVPEHALGEFEKVLLDRTCGSRIMQAYYYIRHENPAYWDFAYRRERILYTFEKMPQLAAENAARPRFIFANMLVPEPPYLFTRDGGRAQPFGQGSLPADRAFRGREAEYQAAYLDQVYFLNQMLVETTRRIVEQSKRPAVVLILSSRGAPPPHQHGAGAPKERFYNLIMARFPSIGEAEFRLPDDLSLVNVFGLALNHALGLGIPLQPDQTFTVQENRPFQVQPAGL